MNTFKTSKHISIGAARHRAVSALLPAVLLLGSATSHAGFFPPAAGQTNSTAISAGDPAIESWASGYQDYNLGTHVDAEFQTPEKSIGAPGNSDGNNQGYIFDIVSLGRGGSITLTFTPPINNGTGTDFAVFENSITDDFIELAVVEVSSDGITFARFPAFSSVPGPVGGFGSVNTTDVEQVAGKYRAGFGTPFDLQQLAGTPGVDLNNIRYVRLTDIVGNGTFPNDMNPANLADWLAIAEEDLPQILVDWANAAPAVIYDVYPTIGSAGFDLDAIGALNVGPFVISVDVDSFDATNNIDPESTANLPVAIFTTSIADGDDVDFNAADVDMSSLKLGYGEAPAIAGPFKYDVDADGDIDSSYMFQIQSTGIACDDVDISLSGQTTGADTFTASDFVVTPECDSGGCHP